LTYEKSIEKKGHMHFNISEKVVHALYGVGTINKMVIQESPVGDKHLYYEILFPNTTIWSPVNLLTTKLRSLSDRDELENCRQLLKSSPEPLNPDPRNRKSDLVDHIKIGTLMARCEVVRDLTGHKKNKPLSEVYSGLLNNTKELVYEEWAAIECISSSDAANEIDTLLKNNS